MEQAAGRVHRDFNIVKKVINEVVVDLFELHVDFVETKVEEIKARLNLDPSKILSVGEQTLLGEMVAAVKADALIEIGDRNFQVTHRMPCPSTMKSVRFLRIHMLAPKPDIQREITSDYGLKGENRSERLLSAPLPVLPSQGRLLLIRLGRRVSGRSSAQVCVSVEVPTVLAEYLHIKNLKAALFVSRR
ncbi:hypothetical protein FQN54_008470 [Arachnomyces sp. PD_36]|nr:hypothetical protein FQN54_008470 [Arachnomyces sp. PD_36]